MGILTFPESVLNCLREVDDDAQVSEEPGIATNARRMLAAATAGDDAEFGAAVTAFGEACTSAGA